MPPKTGKGRKVVSEPRPRSSDGDGDAGPSRKAQATASPKGKAKSSGQTKGKRPSGVSKAQDVQRMLWPSNHPRTIAFTES